jgi:hypothetical protein
MRLKRSCQVERNAILRISFGGQDLLKSKCHSSDGPNEKNFVQSFSFLVSRIQPFQYVRDPCPPAAHGLAPGHLLDPSCDWFLNLPLTMGRHHTLQALSPKT